MEYKILELETTGIVVSKIKIKEIQNGINELVKSKTSLKSIFEKGDE